MEIRAPQNPEVEALERLGDEIAELSAHIEVATARLLDMIREFDARGGWGNGFKSCAEWLSWGSGWTSVPPTSAFAWRARCPVFRASARRWRAVSSHTPR